MNIGGRGRFNLGKRTYQTPQTCGENGVPEPVPLFVDLRQWCEENHYSKVQARRLMEQRKLAVIKCKNRVFVKQIQEIEPECYG